MLAQGATRTDIDATLFLHGVMLERVNAGSLDVILPKKRKPKRSKK